jgi:hypothetical protein
MLLKPQHYIDIGAGGKCKSRCKVPHAPCNSKSRPRVFIQLSGYPFIFRFANGAEPLLGRAPLARDAAGVEAMGGGHAPGKRARVTEAPGSYCCYTT